MNLIMRLLGIRENSQFEAEVAELQRRTGAKTPEEAIEAAVAREANLLRKLEQSSAVRIMGSNPSGQEVVYH
jgi:hypothetical protein